MSKTALLVGRFHALTRAQATWLAGLGRDSSIDRLVCVLTSADHAGTRRNPLDVETREQIMRPALAATGKPFELVEVRDIPDDARWPAHVVAAAARETGRALPAAGTVVHSANSEVRALFAAAGFETVAQPAGSCTPSELIDLIVRGRPWEEQAAPSTVEVYRARGVPERLRRIFADRLRTDDGELAHQRDFDSYGALMDAALKQKLDDLLPWVVPGRIVDKGCGTGKLMVELARRFPDSAFVGVDLSREFLRRSDENTYASGDVQLIARDAADAAVAEGSASTVIFSSIMHEIYTYSGYDRARIDRALANAARELRPGGRMLMRDGVSPGDQIWRLTLLDESTRQSFARFASEFKHGQGAAHERLSDGRVRLSAHLANEFLCKKDYQKNWHIEVHEEYGALTTDGWRAALERAGLRVCEIRAYCNDWIVAHRYAGSVSLTDDADRPLPWPATNVVVVGER